MPKNKDLKRRVRERMEKTGESYAAARAQLIDRKAKLEQERYAELAEMSESSVVRATGRDWSWWVDTLDAAGATELAHREVALWVHEEHGVSPWWSQQVVVGYERIRGLRTVGQRRDGGFDANKSRTFPVAVEVLFEAFVDEGTRSRWLGDLPWSERASQENRSLRLDVEEGRIAALWFTDKGAGKSSVQVQEGGHPTKVSAEAAKSRWQERFDALAQQFVT